VRGQSNVVGVALLLSVTVVAMGGLTVGIGTVVQENAESADVRRVADGMADALRPVETTGADRGRISFDGGRLSTVEREVRVANATATRVVDVGALVYEDGDRRVAFLSGAVTVGTGRSSQVYRRPPITANYRSEVLVVGAARLGAGSVGRSGEGATTAVLRTNVSHDRETLGEGRYRVGVETVATGAWRRAFQRVNATVVGLRDPDGDGVDSVVARFPGERRAHLVVHEMNLEVGR
jgi:hypothetical protein